MEHYIDNRKSQMIGFIEILNDIGLNIVHIDRTFYVFTEFESADPSINANYISIIGKNITAQVENAVQKEGYTERMKTELFQKLDGEKGKRREFSANIEWRKYLANV